MRMGGGGDAVLSKKYIFFIHFSFTKKINLLASVNLQFQSINLGGDNVVDLLL